MAVKVVVKITSFVDVISKICNFRRIYISRAVYREVKVYYNVVVTRISNYPIFSNDSLTDNK